jgi:hypothetical protein
VPATSTLSHPIARNSNALNIACDRRYKTAGPDPVATGATARADSMIAIWLMVE